MTPAMATCKSCGDEYAVNNADPKPDTCETCAEFYRASDSSVGAPAQPIDRYLRAVKRLFMRSPSSSPVRALELVGANASMTLEDMAKLGPTLTCELLEKYLEDKGGI